VTNVKIFLLSFFSLFIILTMMSPVAQAKSANDCGRTFFGLPYWYKYLDFDKDCNIKTKDQENVPAKIILGIIDIALFLAGLLSVIMIMWGGFQFIFANGEPGSIANARKTILNAVIGLIIAILASQIVRFVAFLLSRPA
jgi:hypothetical protein